MEYAWLTLNIKVPYIHHDIRKQYLILMYLNALILKFMT